MKYVYTTVPGAELRIGSALATNTVPAVVSDDVARELREAGREVKADPEKGIVGRPERRGLRIESKPDQEALPAKEPAAADKKSPTKGQES